MTTPTPGASNATGGTKLAAVPAGARRRLSWRVGEVFEVRTETPRANSISLRVPGWERHRAGQHVDVRLTAEDGYQRSSAATP